MQSHTSSKVARLSSNHVNYFGIALVVSTVSPSSPWRKDPLTEIPFLGTGSTPLNGSDLSGSCSKLRDLSDGLRHGSL